MKKLFPSTLLAGTVLAGFVATAGAQELVTTDRVGSPDAPNVLTMRANPNQSTNSPSPEQKAAFEKVWQEFAEAHPDWQIQFEFFGQDIGGEHARLLEQARAGRAPDCVTVDSFQLALFIDNGVLKPLDDYFSQEEIDDLFPFIREGVTGPDGSIYAWWWGTDLRVLYRNTEIVPEAPQTWEELQAAALKATESGIEGVLFNGGRWEGTTFDWLANFWAQGGSLVDDSGKPIFGEGENREKMLTAINYFKGLVDSGAAPKRVATIKDYNDFNAAAIAGSAAMFFGGHWQHFQLMEAMPEAEFAKWDVSELPGPSADERSTGTGGWTVAAFSDDPAKVEMCANVMREVYMGPANEVIGDLPTRESLFASLPKFQDPYFGKLKEYLVNGHARPGVPIYPEISNQIQIMMGEVLSGTKEPEAALDGAWNRVMDAYGKL
ncbi:extracellular solute-binding protein [Chelativorans salis]|uniref:Extracellular solute-binding protein n=1 Tax=Chelativorans salis TaxID=2978478 RepID=A0ABT2LWT5_9HYPH|nr:extracellular solute-binding protein [Chelativorans sp. EGI FJ00035]MCT7378058.1 extracellular solute-binding protein [Chelativorans sp. EGI FJ00035]